FVNELVILPDIEKRLESFVRMAHGIVIFPGGPGTAEELLYLLGILAHPDNQSMPFPLIITGPKDTEPYLNSLHDFVGSTLGKRAQARYQLIIDDAEAVAAAMKQGIDDVRSWRNEQKDAYFYNWNMRIEPDFQHPFDPTHEAMAALELTTELPEHHLASNLRKVFSGIVAGNVKPDGRERVAKYGPYQLKGEKKLMQQLDQLLTSMVAKGRMKLSGEYKPCYRIG
ncbi:MAG: pyrimidine/purine nucleotide monophosphate nucleosidase domain-containing protein, partial [Oceanobacter sp.]